MVFCFVSTTSIIPHGGRFCLPPFCGNYSYAILDESGRIVCGSYALYVSRQYLDLIERAPNPGRRVPGLAWGGPLPGPPAPAPGLVRCRPPPGSALRPRPALRPKSNKKGVLFNSRGLNKTAFVVRFWAGLAALRPAAGPPPFGLRAPCAPRGSLPRSWCLPGASPGARFCPTVPPGALTASAQEGHPP